ncbi:hypothetical protein ES703_27196 [subsurface metagenome]
MDKEQDLRLRLFNSLLTSPHRDLNKLYPTHQEIMRQDPLFYQQLASWYFEKGEVRDHKEMFIINLVRSDFEGHRDIGLALLRGLPPYELCRVLDFIKGWQTDSEKHGLFCNVPRSMRTEIVRYLREREQDNKRLDSAIIFARRYLKRMYAVLHIAPSQRAQAILFDNEPPEDSTLYALKLIAKEGQPSKQARLIMRYKVPYRIASTVIRAMTPTVLLALINSMSSQELINNMASLKRHGSFDNPEVKALVKEKLQKAKKDKRVSAYKAKKALETAQVSKDLEKELEEVTEAQVKAKGKIKRPTALLIDKSGSMEQAVELGKRISSMLSSICEADLFVYAFDTMAYPIQPQGASLADWEKAFAGINPGGGTSCGVALESMRRKGQYVEQIILVTDGGENNPPFFVPSLKTYRKDTNTDPNVCFVKIEGSDLSQRLEEQCRLEGIMTDSFLFKGDYYALPNLLPLVSKPSKLELLEEIMGWPLPQRREN